MSGTSEKIAALNEAGFTPEPPPDEWGEPVPFDTIEAPDFPIESLPAPVADFVEAQSESMQTPVEMGGVLSLGVLATAFQSRYELQARADWKEQLSLYTVAVMKPAERKTAVIRSLTAPMYDYEAQIRELEVGDIEWSRTEKEILQKSLEAVKNSAVKAKSAVEREKALNEARALSEQLSTYKDKHPFRLLVDDTTTEKLVELMDAQGGCISVASAEGGVFDAMAGRYDKNANFDVYLKGHAGDVITVDRIGRKSNHIPKPRMSMILTVQPEVLTGLMSNPRFRGRGLCGRFLYAMCKSKVGRRSADPDAIPQRVKDDYREFIRCLLVNRDSGILTLDGEAYRVLLGYYEANEKRLINEFEHMQDWGGKLVGAMLRIAGLIHASEHIGNTCETKISADTLEAAMKIAECLSFHAMAAYQCMGADESTADAKYILKRIQEFSAESITRAELTRLCRGRFPKADDMDRPLELLAEYGYVRRAESEIGYNNRRQIEYKINPRCLWK